MYRNNIIPQSLFYTLMNKSVFTLFFKGSVPSLAIYSLINLQLLLIFSYAIIGKFKYISDQTQKLIEQVNFVYPYLKDGLYNFIKRSRCPSNFKVILHVWAFWFQGQL